MTKENAEEQGKIKEEFGETANGKDENTDEKKEIKTKTFGRGFGGLDDE